LHSFDRVQEDEANWLAGCLLLPRDALVHIRRQGWTVLQAVRAFGVSADMVQYRINVTGVDVQLSRRRGARR
jgi:Zn-dependent peptidase ImmA (M78 family)